MRLVLLIFLLILSSSTKADSTCFGTTSAGRLEDACKLPTSGNNFRAYSSLLGLAGRTYAHCDVTDIVLDTYAALHDSMPDKRYVYGETGSRYGGQFKPHKTHQNGLSVDFMIPVMNKNDQSVALPTHILNKYGYDIDFTLDGKYKDLAIDYEAFAAHLAATKIMAEKHGVGIWRVLFDPQMQSALRDTEPWPLISDLNFSKKRSWVRHDDHYHIDFVIPCNDL